MTRLLFAALLLAACNNNGKEQTTSHESGAHSGHNAPATQTTGPAAQMVQMMHGMMDEMHAVKTSGNADTDFAALMRAHHLAAIRMASLEAAAGTDTALRRMAERMTADQQREVAAFDAFLAKKKAGRDSAFFQKAMHGMTDMKMDAGASGSLDRTFVTHMIPHHRGAVDMARAYLETGAADAGLKKVAQDIIASQEKEIGELEAWLARNP